MFSAQLVELVNRLPRTPAAEKFAGKRVTVSGTLDAKTKTIQMESITTAK